MKESALKTDNDAIHSRAPTGGLGNPPTVGFVNPPIGGENQFAQLVRRSRPFSAKLMTAVRAYLS